MDLANTLEIEIELLKFWKHPSSSDERGRMFMSECMLSESYGVVYLEGSARRLWQPEAGVRLWRHTDLVSVPDAAHNGRVTSGK